MHLPTIQIQNLHFAFQQKILFHQLDLVLPAGQWVGLLGPSGIGKSTLLRLIAGLLPLPAGSQISASNHLPVAAQVAYMGQSDLLLPWLTVLSNSLLSIKLQPTNKNLMAHKQQQTLALLNQVGLSEVIHAYPAALSGGMRQRVALVRTLLMDKPIILMDEPFSALDAITRYNLQALAAKVLANKTVFFISHDPQEALRLAHTIYIMHGQPARLKKVTDINSPIPREVTQAELIPLYQQLYSELAQASLQDKYDRQP